MQVITPNNVKIYNLSAGKSLPEWISDRKKRALLKKDTELRERIELIQDLEMPVVSNQVQLSPDGQYIFVTGVYKPRVKCFDTTQLSMKFERCFDSECSKFKIISEDYSKAVFMLADRYIEFHAQYGKYYKTRIPKFGNDFDYLYSSCDLYFVGTSNEVFRLNLEQGKFLTSLQTSCSENTCCQFNPVHELFALGNKNGYVECWDPRAPKNVALLDCKLDDYLDSIDMKNNCSITTLKYRDGLNLAVGTSTGHILLYDIRSNKPTLIKDHRYELPIKEIQWHDSSDNIISIDKRVCKIWDRHTGKPYTSIEPGTALNGLSVVPNSGMLFMSNEAPKVLVYYIPSIGPAPKWCSFLDNLTEELETSSSNNVYDDYKFVTKTELDGLGLSNLIGTNILRAYMHGYFMDIRLYRKAKQVAEPFNYQEYKQRQMKEVLDKERIPRVKITKLPQVNKELVLKLRQEAKTKKENVANKVLLEDDRFASLFTNADYQINMDSEEFRLLNPVVQKINEKLSKPAVQLADKYEHVELSDEDNGPKKYESSSTDDEDDDDNEEEDEESSDDEHTIKKSLKEQYQKLAKEKRMEQKQQKQSNGYSNTNNKVNVKQPKFYEIKDDSHAFAKQNDILKREKIKKLPIEQRIKASEHNKNYNDTVTVHNDSIGNRQMTFLSKRAKKEEQQQKKSEMHHLERRGIRRSAGSIIKTLRKPDNAKYFKRPK